jgi:hypothetical protein
MHYQIDQTKAIYDIIDGDIVIINLDNGNYYNVTGVGAAIWKQLNKGASADGILRALGNIYDGDTEIIKKDLNDFLADLIEEKLIKESDGSSANQQDSQSQAIETKQVYTPPELEIFTDMQDFLLVDPIHEVDENGLPKFTPPSLE